MHRKSISPAFKYKYGFADDSVAVVMDDGFDLPFSNLRQPLYIEAKMVPISWPMVHGMCAAKPTGIEITGSVVTKKLFPYGCTNLRLTEMPKPLDSNDLKGEKQ